MFRTKYVIAWPPLFSIVFPQTPASKCENENKAEIALHAMSPVSKEQMNIIKLIK